MSFNDKEDVMIKKLIIIWTDVLKIPYGIKWWVEGLSHFVSNALKPGLAETIAKWVKCAPNSGTRDRAGLVSFQI